MRVSISRVSPFQRVILSLVLGIAFGLVVGEPAGKLEIGGNAYIKLLQMTVLPYILFSLIGGLGRLDMAMARRIGVVGAGLILFLWGTTMVALLLMPLSYPNWSSAAFFSSSLVSKPAVFDPLALYIPANIFNVLANTTVPAVVVFSIGMGIALIGVSNKGGLLESMQNVSDALMKMASFVAKLAPLGIFALSATAAGTLDIQSLTRLQVYLWVYTAAWTVLTFFTLPMFIAWATPFSYREVMKDARTAMVTAFAAGTVLVVLPMIVERSKTLLEKHDIKTAEACTAIDVLVPTAYSFPSVGTLLGIGFVLFSGWFVGSPLEIGQYPTFVVTGAVTSFGTMAVALPFMLDFFHLPSDLFQLYLLGSVVTGRLATVLATMHAVVISLLGACAMLGLLNKVGLFKVLAATLVLMALVMGGLGITLTKVIPYEYAGYDSFISMAPMIDPDNEQIVELPDKPEGSVVAGPRLDLIQDRGVLRVGYPLDALPFAFRNKHDQMAGFDIDLMRVMARDLGVDLEWVRLDKARVGTALDEGRIDVFVGGLIMTSDRIRHWSFSKGYMDEHIGFIVPDHRRTTFASMDRIVAVDSLRIGVLDVLNESLYGPIIEEYFEDAEIVPISSPRDFMTGEVDVDAVIYTAESGSAWTLIYPDYSVVIPSGMSAMARLGVVLPRDQSSYAQFINQWLDIKNTRGLLSRLERYWIYGGGQSAGEE